MRKISLLLVLFAAAFFLASCGGSSATTPVTPSSLPISVEYLDGAADVALDSTFKATFSQAVDTTTVTTSTFFVVEAGTANIAAPIEANRALPIKAAYDATTCALANAIASSVSCASNTECTLDPTNNLTSGTQYTLCLTTGIKLADGVTSYVGTQATFTTDAVTAAVIDAWGRAVNGNTSVNPTSLRLMFSEDMHLATVVDPNISLTCNGAVQAITIAQAQTPEQTASLKTFDVTHSNPDALQLLNCTLDITAAVQTLSGASVTAASHAFTNACAIDGPFNTAAQACWTVSTGASNTWTTWDLLTANIISYNDGDILYSTATQAAATTARIYKTVNVPSTDFQITINVDNPVGFVDNTDDILALRLGNSPTAEVWLYVSVAGIGGGAMAAETYFENTYTGYYSKYWSNAPLDSPASYSITLTVDTTNGIQMSYTRNGVASAIGNSFAVGSSPFPDATNINTQLLNYAGNSWELALWFKGLPAVTATVTSISTTGISSATQY